MKLIPQDFCDTDLYKFSMGQAVLNQFPNEIARYRYFNRARNKSYPVGFAKKVYDQIQMMCDLSLTYEMFDFFHEKCMWMKPSYLTWLKYYRFNPDDIIQCGQNQNGELEIEIEGLWHETIFWEVPLLYIISELSHGEQQPAEDSIKRIFHKADIMAQAGVDWMDFGTRRRFNYHSQEAVVDIMSKNKYQPFFKGTSNPYLARLCEVEARGTMAHEWIMGMQAIYGVENCNKKALEHWVKEYKNDLLIALTDTVTTEVFLRDFDESYAQLFDGVRVDSGNPFARGDVIGQHYENLGIDPKKKLLIFSDQLNCQKAIDLHDYFNGRIKTLMGIGTFLTNDVGITAPNHVIKLTHLNNKPVIKISDGDGKWVGSFREVREAKMKLNI